MFIYQLSLRLIRYYDNGNVASIKYQSVSYALDSKLIHDWKVDKFIEHMRCEAERCRVVKVERWKDENMRENCYLHIISLDCLFYLDLYKETKL